MGEPRERPWDTLDAIERCCGRDKAAFCPEQLRKG